MHLYQKMEQKICCDAFQERDWLGQSRRHPDWKGKKIYLFANSYTDDHNYMTTSLKDAKASARNADVVAGLFNKEIEGLDEWLTQNNFR